MNQHIDELVRLAKDVAQDEGIALATLSTRIADDGQLLTRLAAGKRDITTGRLIKLTEKLNAIRAAHGPLRAAPEERPRDVA